MQPSEPPRWAGVRLGPALVGLLYALLVGSAALSFFGRRFPGSLPRVVDAVTPWLFLAFVLCFAFYRLGIVHAGKYPAFKAYFQIALMLVVWILLTPGARLAFSPAHEVQPPPPALEALLADANPAVRRLAAEVAQYRPGGLAYAPLLVRALTDADPAVRRQAHESLVRLSGQDLGDPDDPRAVRAWRERYP